MRHLIVVQARQGSTRLPGKALRMIGGQTVIQHVMARLPDLPTVIATTTDPSDDELYQHCVDTFNCDVYRGDPVDVLYRFWRVARNYEPRFVIRVTADCPLLSPVLLEKLIQATRDEPRADYYGIKAAPQGLHQEIISRDALNRTQEHAILQPDREHVVTYALRHRTFSKHWISAGHELEKRSHWRLSLDTPKDLALMKRLYRLSKKELFSLSSPQLVRLVESDPEALATVTR